MGRVSKRKAVEKQFVVNSSVRRYRAGIYARLSSDQDIKKNESVEVQIEIARKFVEEFNQKNTGEVIDVVECYTDLGKTGSNFEREGFQRLLQEIRLGEINCVIVKDLSRFGRNYLEAGNYIEKIFPFLGVRFIAVADGFDTGKEGNENKQMASEIKNLVNDMYAKDFSKKAKMYLRLSIEDNAIANSSDCVLLPAGLRSRKVQWEVPRKSNGWAYGFGRANVWYASEEDSRLQDYLTRLVKQIDEYDGENWIDKYAK